MTVPEPKNPYLAEPDIPDTEVIAVAVPAPVFVDSTGRRSRLLRRLAYAFGLLVMLYGGLICVSLAGGPVNSSAVLPLPGLEIRQNDDRTPARPNPTPQPDPRRSRSLMLTDALNRRAGAGSEARIESTRAPSVLARPTAGKTPSPSPSPTRPAESATTGPATRPTTRPTPRPTTPATPPSTTAPPNAADPTVTPKAAPVGPTTGAGGR